MQQGHGQGFWDGQASGCLWHLHAGATVEATYVGLL